MMQQQDTRPYSSATHPQDAACCCCFHVCAQRGPRVQWLWRGCGWLATPQQQRYAAVVLQPWCQQFTTITTHLSFTLCCVVPYRTPQGPSSSGLWRGVHAMDTAAQHVCRYLAAGARRRTSWGLAESVICPVSSFGAGAQMLEWCRPPLPSLSPAHMACFLLQHIFIFQRHHHPTFCLFANPACAYPL